MAKYRVDTDNGSYEVETAEDTIQKESGIEQFGTGLAEGGKSLMPSSKTLATVVAPMLPQAAETLLRPTYGKYLETVQGMIDKTPRPQTVGGQVARGLGYIFPTLVPMSRGIQAVETSGNMAVNRIMRELVRRGISPENIRKIIQNKFLQGTLSTVAKPATGFMGYEAGKTALTQEDVTPQQIEESAIQGARTGAIFGPATRLGATLIPGRAGSIVGGALAGAATAPEGERVAGAITQSALAGMTPARRFAKQPEVRRKEAVEAYRNLIRPEKSELKAIEIGKGRDVNEFFDIAARERLPIEKSSDGKMDTTLAREAIGDRISRIHENLNAILKGDKAQKFDIIDIGEKAKEIARERTKNAKELSESEAEIDEYIQAEVNRLGRWKMTGEEANNIKQGMWSIGYNLLKPTAKVNAARIGTAIREAIEKGYPDKDIRMLNKESGDYNTLNTLLTNAHGRVVPGGRLGKYFGRTIFGIAGSKFGPVGTMVGQWLGGKATDIASSPEMITKRAGAKYPIPRAGKDFAVGAAASSEIGKDLIPLSIKNDITVRDQSGQRKTLTPEPNIVIEPIVKGGQIVKYQVHDGQDVTVNKSVGQDLMNKYGKKASVGEFAPELKDVEVVEKGERAPQLTFEQYLDRLDVKDRSPKNLVHFRRIYNSELNNPGVLTSQPTKYNRPDLVLPGGTNYREVLIKAPSNEQANINSKNIRILQDNLDKIENDIQSIVSQYPIISKRPSEINERLKVFRDAQIRLSSELRQEQKRIPSETFKSSHWDEPNVIAHIRLNDRTTPDGKKVLFVEEIQSDWAREGRDKGFKDESAQKIAKDKYEALIREQQDLTSKLLNGRSPTADILKTIAKSEEQKALSARINEADAELERVSGRVVPNNPLLKNWQELALKKVLKTAVDGNYDAVAWINGEQTANRYDLSKQVDAIGFTKLAVREGAVKISLHKDGRIIDTRTVDNIKELESFIGKDVANKIYNGEKEEGLLKGVDLKIGGEWAKNLYDKQVPNILKKLTGGEIKQTSIKSKNKYTKQQMIELTQDIKNRIK